MTREVISYYNNNGSDVYACLLDCSKAFDRVRHDKLLQNLYIVVDFIWEGKTFKIAYNVLIQQAEEGGLKLVDFEDKVKSLKVMWVKRLIKDKKERWMATPSSLYKTQNLLNISCSIKTQLKWNQNL